MTMMPFLRPILIVAALFGLWWLLVWVLAVPSFILPSPDRVIVTAVMHLDLLGHHAGVTLVEILLGLLLGILLGCFSALSLTLWQGLRPWLLPVLVVSQAIPVFALAPVLVLWLGYGLASKVAMATLIIYFPVTAAFYDGLRRTEPGWLDLARNMNARPLLVLRYLQIPAALPALTSGLRVAAATAPIGAVVGEWVGSSAGLGHLMLHANARMEIDLMFSALLVLAIIALLLYRSVDIVCRRALPWVSDA